MGLAVEQLLASMLSTMEIITAEGGALWSDVDDEAAKFGLATVDGTVNDTGRSGKPLPFPNTTINYLPYCIFYMAVISHFHLRVLSHQPQIKHLCLH